MTTPDPRPQINLGQNVSLSERTSWKVGGTADYFLEPADVEELKAAVRWAQEKSLPISVIGHGSNVLVSDDGVEGLVLGMGALNQVSEPEIRDGHFTVRCQAGAAKSDLLKLFIKAQLEPAVFLAGLPGDIGGGVVMNAGVGTQTRPKEFCEIIDSIEVLKTEDPDLKIETYQSSEIQWVYRHSLGWQPGIVTAATIRWPNEPDADVLKKVRAGNTRRKSTQPLDKPSCGSVFKNPEGAHSGALIEKAGLKGFSIGGAQVSEKHGNFIINKGGATALEIHQVMVHVQDVIKEKLGYSLKNEVAYLGRWKDLK